MTDNKCKNNYGAKLDSLQGKVFFDPESKGHWQQAKLHDVLCEGSRVRVERYSRASISLSNGVVLRLDEGTVLSLNGIAPDQPTLLDLLTGFIHFISRTPRRLEVTSPIANAGPEGTEFAMSVDDTQASLWVYEGGVRFFNSKGSVSIKPGQGAQALAGQAPRAQIDIKPQDAVNWALYYPPLLPYPDASAKIDAGIRTAIQDFRHGRIDDALFRLDALASEQRSPFFYKVRGAMRLTAGRVDLAEQDIRAILANKPNDADALALQSVLALTQNRKEEALQLANNALTSDPASPTAYSALSYAEQGRFELDKALAAADQATKYAPHDAMVWARKAELELSQGLTSESKEAAQKASELDATLERTQTVMGFSYLLRIDADKALKAFNQAIQLDSTSPLARLGLGLAKIRNGDLEEGRRDLEIAAILDPNDSIVRSYLGKAYYEEKRSVLAEDQFKLAKDRDPKDPTPFFYDAINKQVTNRPVEALHDMQKAIELNDNRGVYRSKLLLDEDAAARTANMARIYNDLGFGRVALKEAWKSLSYDSTNPSAHRFLSDAYIGQPRYRIARASELLQAQLLQPINITPVQPQLTAENIGILNTTGPTSLSTNEYDPLYTSNGAHVVLNGAYGSNNTKTDNAIVSGVYNKLSMSLGQFHYQTDGFRQNDDYQQNIYDVFTQYSFTPAFNLQFELKSESIRGGDVSTRLNSYHDEDMRNTIKQDTARIGGHYRIDSDQDFIVSAFSTSRKDFTSVFFDPSTFKNTIKESGYQTEMQYFYHPGPFDITGGLGYLDLSNKKSMEMFNNEQLNFSTSSASTKQFYNAYFYSKQRLLPSIITILGIGFDSYHSDEILGRNRDQFSPKFGVIWNPVNSLTLRGAAFRTLNRPLTSNQTIEPTQIAGFNQFFDSSNGTSAWQYSLGVDYSPTKFLFLGGETNWRKAIQPGFTRNTVRDETYHLTYIYMIPVKWMSVRSEYRYEKNGENVVTALPDFTNPSDLISHQVPISINFFHSNGLIANITGTYVNQNATFVVDKNKLENFSEKFWTIDASIGFRFPKRIGLISFEVRNLLDNRFNFQSAFDASGPQLSPYVPERQFFAKLSLFY